MGTAAWVLMLLPVASWVSSLAAAAYLQRHGDRRAATATAAVAIGIWLVVFAAGVAVAVASRVAPAETSADGPLPPSLIVAGACLAGFLLASPLAWIVALFAYAGRSAEPATRAAQSGR